MDDSESCLCRAEECRTRDEEREGGNRVLNDGNDCESRFVEDGAWRAGLIMRIGVCFAEKKTDALMLEVQRLRRRMER